MKWNEMKHRTQVKWNGFICLSVFMMKTRFVVLVNFSSHIVNQFRFVDNFLMFSENKEFCRVLIHSTKKKLKLGPNLKNKKKIKIGWCFSPFVKPGIISVFHPDLSRYTYDPNKNISQKITKLIERFEVPKRYFPLAFRLYIY